MNPYTKTHTLLLVLTLIIFVTGCKTTDDNYTKNLSDNNYSVNVNGKTYIFIFERFRDAFNIVFFLIN